MSDHHPPQSPYPHQQPYPGGPTGQPEYLDSTGGQRWEPVPPTPRRSRKPWILGAVAAVAVAGAAGAGWAAYTFLSGGPNAAEAMPKDTLAYVGLNLDPSGGQKIAAIRTLNKFPKFKELGINADDDVREQFLDSVVECPGVTYAKDFKPWLGKSVGLGVVPGADPDTSRTLEPIMAVHISDAAAFEKAMKSITSACGSEDVSYAVSGDWALFGKDQSSVSRISGDVKAGTLAEVAEYQTWTDRAGGDGIMTMYVAPGAAATIAQGLSQVQNSLNGFSTMTSDNVLPPEALEALKDFEGAAASLRFNDGGLELETAAGAGAGWKGFASGPALGDLVTTLPADTAFAYGMGLKEGWAGDLLDQVTRTLGTEADVSGLIAELESSTGLEVPADIEAALGEGLVVSVGNDIDLETARNSSDGTDVPVGVRVKAAPEDIQSVMDKLGASVGAEGEDLLSPQDAGDFSVIAPDAAYRKDLAAKGSLGEAKTFKSVVSHPDDANMVLFVDFDAGDDWLTRMASDADPQIAENLQPLSAFGLSTWVEGDATHALLRISTD